MSELRVDSVKSKGGGAPDLPKGVTISGIATAATLGATTVDVSNVNVSGVVTSGTLSGDLLSTGTPTLGLGVTINSSGVAISGVATAGIVSATTLYGDGSNITGVAASIAPLFYQPDPGDTGVSFPAGIGITFNSQVKAGTGNVTLSIANAGVAGTVVENFGVGSSVTISENKVTIDPTADLSVGQDYIISYPSGCFTNNEGSDYVGTAYTFQARVYSYQLWAMGDSELNNSGGDRSSPIQIPGTTWNVIATNEDSGWATRTDGTLWGWGNNSRGQLGQNNTTPAASPVQVPGTWSAIGSGGNTNTAGAINTDGELYTWGKGEMGVLGQNSVTPSGHGKSSPIQIPGTTWSDLQIGESYMAALKTDGTLWTWGTNDNGILGQNSPDGDHRSSPVQIPGTTWSKISTGSNYMQGIKTDGTLWVWGQNFFGALGLNQANATLNGTSSPVQIPGTTWSTVGGSKYGPLATKTDNTLWAWGYNSYGQLGTNNKTTYSSPIQIPGTTWDKVDGGKEQAIATKTDGSLWSWGRNASGGLGQNNTTSYSSPVQVGSDTDWYDISHDFSRAGLMIKRV